METTLKTNEVLKLERHIIILKDRIENEVDIISIDLWTTKLNSIIDKLNKLK